MARDLHALWARLETIAAQSPKSLRLRAGVSEEAIRAAEQTLGVVLPADFRASLLVHDGQDVGDDPDDVFEWLPGHAPLASLDAIVEEWRRECETFAQMYAPDERAEEIENGRLHHFLWHPRRVPIAGNPWWDQDNTYLDHFPGSRGVAGQLVGFGKADFGTFVAPSFGDALELYVRGLESGEWSFRDGQCLPRAKGMTWTKFVKKKLRLCDAGAQLP